jgi:hypothetical protein
MYPGYPTPPDGFPSGRASFGAPAREDGGEQAHLALVIAKTFRTAKTFRSPSANFFRQEKRLRDHGDAPDCSM